MSTIAAGTTSGTALVSTGDTSGTLQLQVNGTTPAVTINTSGAVGVGSSPSYGTSGQVLTSAGSGAAPTWGTVSTGAYGADLSFTDYSLTVPTALSSTTNTPRVQTFALTATSELLLFGGDASICAVVWDSSAGSFGTPVLVRTGGNYLTNAAFCAAMISSTSVLVCSLQTNDTALQTVVLSISGTTITVGTPVSTTLANAGSLVSLPTRLVTVGSSYVLNYYDTATTVPRFRAITVSGTTPTVGAELVYSAGGTSTTRMYSYAYSSSILLSISQSSTTLYAYPISVSGSTLTGGTAATLTVGNANFSTGVLSTGRIALAYVNSSVLCQTGLISVAGTTASITTAAGTFSGSNPTMAVYGSQAFILGNTAGDVNVLTDTAGTPSVGTGFTVALAAGAIVHATSAGKFYVASTTAGDSQYAVYSISGGSPVLDRLLQGVTGSAAPVQVASIGSNAPYTVPMAGAPTSANTATGNNVSLRTSAGKIAPRTTNQPFTVTFDGTNAAKLQQVQYFGGQVANSSLSDATMWGTFPQPTTTSTAVPLRRIQLS